MLMKLGISVDCGLTESFPVRGRRKSDDCEVGMQTCGHPDICLGGQLLLVPQGSEHLLAEREGSFYSFHSVWIIVFLKKFKKKQSLLQI